MSTRKLLRLLPALGFLGCAQWLPAAPSLTTIQDILYKADGTRFNGTLSIQWTNFQAGDASIVATQSLTVQVVNGVLKIQLVPTTNASAGANYTVNYSSVGKFQFTETWAVPPSSTTLRVRDVRVSSGTTVGTPAVSGSQVQISDVQGLSNELLARPMRGVAFAPGRAAVINSSGQLDAAQGNLSDCVHVDGSSSPCSTGGGSGGSTVGYVDEEIPSGLVNGANATFTTSLTAAPAASLMLYRNGLLMRQNSDYTLSGNTITFYAASVPQSGDSLLASYRYAIAGPIVSGLSTQNAPEVLCNVAGSTTAAAVQTTLGSCNIAANKLVAGDLVEIKFAFTHQGTATGFNPAVSFGSTALSQRAMLASDTAMTGLATVLVSSAGALTHFTSTQSPGGLPVISQGGVAGTIQTINTVTLGAGLSQSGTMDSVSLKYFLVVRYPSPQ